MLLLINNLPDLISSHSPTQVGLLVTPTGKKKLRTALVLQDGMTTQDIPWPELEAVFVDGTDQYKFSPDVYRICLQAKQHRKWIHFGRINSKRKLSLAHDYHAHSVDGLHWSFYTHKNLAQGIEWVQSIKSQGRLFDNATLIQDH